ncbi:MAG: hypothetical protein JXR39_03185 [Marinilabiliaceae bacterium]|nr:hypothetical protein [Marinilabiliaceae bacterium]
MKPFLWMMAGCLLSMGAWAQNRVSHFSTVDSSGFYKIELPRDGVGLMAPDYCNMRILNQQGREVPYKPLSERAAYQTADFVTLPLVEQQMLPDSVTILVFHNADQRRIDHLALQIGNAGVEKQMRLTGSNDRVTWFSVRENAMFSTVSNPDDVSQMKLIDCPLVNYAWLRLEIDDRRTSPVNVMRGGIYLTRSEMPVVPCDTLPLRMNCTDDASAKTTRVQVLFDGTHWLDRVEVQVQAPPFFRREVDFYVIERDTAAILRERYHMGAVFASGEPIVMYPASVRGDGFALVIANKDNPPLEVTHISVFQKKRYLLAWLEQDDSCSLVFGNRYTRAPDYDIQHFNARNDALLPVVMAQPPMLLPNEVKPPVKPSFFKDERFIWAAIVLVMALLGYFTYVLMKEKS